MSTIKEKAQDILDEKTLKIIPENIKKDTQIFNVTGTYEGTVINNQDKTVVVNGTVTADQGYTGLGTVTVNVPTGSGDVKLFETQQAMQADPSAVENDLAIVYRSEINNWQQSTVSQTITFPATVTLPSAVTSSSYCALRGDSNMAEMQLGPDSCYIMGWSEPRIEAYYTSSDGIHYTNEAGEAYTVDCGCEMSVYESEWDDNFGYFMQTGGNVFEGLFQYKNEITPTTYLPAYSLATMFSHTTPQGHPETYIRLPITLTDNSYTIVVHNMTDITVEGQTFHTAVDYDVYTSSLWFYPAQKQFIYEQWNVNDYNYVINTYHNDELINTRTVLCKYGVRDYDVVGRSGGYDAGHILGTYQTTSYVIPSYQNPSGSDYARNYMELVSTGVIDDTGTCYTWTGVYRLSEYISARNQFDLNNSECLLANIKALGKTGAITGTLGSTVSNAFDDNMALLYSKALKTYNNIPSIVVNNDTMKNSISNNVYTIPSRLDGTSLLDTSNVTNMCNMFLYFHNLVCVSNFNTSNVTDTSGMFYSCNNLAIIPNFDTSNVTDMSEMFYNCANLTSIPNFDTSNVTDMVWMFNSCTNLINVPNFNTSKVTGMFGMFQYCDSLTNAPSFDTSNVTRTARMFGNCINLTSVSNFDTSKVTDMYQMFECCNNLSNSSIQNIINMCLISKVNASYKTLNTTNSRSPLYDTIFNSSYYSNRLSELSAAGWSY